MERKKIGITVQILDKAVLTADTIQFYMRSEWT